VTDCKYLGVCRRCSPSGICEVKEIVVEKDGSEGKVVQVTGLGHLEGTTYVNSRNGRNKNKYG